MICLTFCVCFLYTFKAPFDDRKKDFKYPCSSSKNLEKCVRDYFKKSDSCKSVNHQDGKPIFRRRKEVYIPQTNLTVITTDANITFYNPQIRTFYNGDADSKCRRGRTHRLRVNFYSSYSYFLFHQVAKEPIVTGDYVNGTKPLILTAIIPAGDGITKDSMENARVTAYLPTGYPEFVIGPKIAKSTNPVIVNTLKSLKANGPTANLEIFLTEAPNFFLMYLQNYICDFGIPLSTNTWGNTIHV
ncbi:hypothetical protein ABMA27_003287 [Loxostege sticticalis]|uniref:Uncharacterized protein n=1 Tax=Loxostege sticticalis TaxID=481309 RepID=A0ABR3HSL2_LOXSC